MVQERDKKKFLRLFALSAVKNKRIRNRTQKRFVFFVLSVGKTKIVR